MFYFLGADSWDGRSDSVETRRSRHVKCAAIVVAPQCPANEWWSTHDLIRLLDDVQAKYRVDPDRIYVTGMSMGGYGTWALATEFPGRFAAIAPVCGGGDPAEVERLIHISVWAFHGDKDNIVPYTESQRMVSALQALGADARLMTYPECGHDAWTDTYANPDLYTWLFSHKRVRQISTPDAKGSQIAGAPATQPTSAAH